MDVTSLTTHAAVRLRQRGIASEAIDYLETFGHVTHDHRGAEILAMNRRGRQAAQRALGHDAYRRVERLLDTYAVIADGRVVTVGHRTRRVGR